MSAFDRAAERLLKMEGGLADDPRDPGGLTKYGISRRSYPEVDIRSLTPAEAKQIYLTDWWRRYGFGKMPPAIGEQMLLVAVNVGPAPAFRILQRALNAAVRAGLAEDGLYGPRTRAALQRANPEAVVAAMRSETARHYETLIHRNPDLAAFRRGWLRRAYA